MPSDLPNLLFNSPTAKSHRFVLFFYKFVHNKYILLFFGGIYLSSGNWQPNKHTNVQENPYISQPFKVESKKRSGVIICKFCGAYGYMHSDYILIIIINTTYDDASESTHDTSDFQETRKGKWEITFIIRKAFNIFENILTNIIALVNTVQVNWIIQEV